MEGGLKVIDENSMSLSNDDTKKKSNLRSKRFSETSTKKRKNPPASPSYMKSTKSSQAKKEQQVSSGKKKKKSFKRNVRRKTLTHTQAPKFTYRTRSQTKKIESSDERALRLAKEERERVRMERQNVSKFYNKTKHSNRSLEGRVYATDALTIPMSPSLATDRRVSTTTTNNNKKKVFRSAAEQVHAFQNKIPSRFHSVPKNSNPRSNRRRSTTSPASLSLTEPKAFNFRTSLCSGKRGLPKSREEQELEYIRKKGQFKARPLNQRIMESSGELGVPKVNKRPTTKAIGFRSHTAKRASTFLEKQEKKQKTKRRTTRRRKKKKVVPAPPPPQPKKLCVPKTPNLLTNTRSRQVVHVKSTEEIEMEEICDFKALPVPETNEIADIFPVPESKDLTMPETPCLESIQRHRDFKARAKEIRSIQDAEEESKHEFKAKPIPNYAELSRIGVSNPERMELCEPQSPQLESVQRHRQSLLVMKKRIEDETKEIREMANFKARPLNRRVMESSGELGVPKINKLPLTKIIKTSPQFSKMQALKHKELEQERDQRRQVEEKKQKVEEREQKMLDEEKLKEYRKTLVHKARPIECDFSKPGLVTRPSTAELTMPQSPKLRTSSRRRR